MARTIDIKQAATRGSGRVWCGAILALTASIAVMLLASPNAGSSAVYWALSAIALATALAVLAAGEYAWEGMVANARAAGVVAR